MTLFSKLWMMLAMWGEGAEHRLGREAVGRMPGGGDPESVRRIDWDQCTIMSGEQAGRVTSHAPQGPETNETLQAVQVLLGRIRLDDTIPLYVAAVDGGLLHVSEGYETLARTSETVTASVYDEVRSRVDVTLPAGLRAVIEEVRMLGRGISIEERIRVKGQLRYFRSRHFPVLDTRGRVVAVGGTYVDCTREIESLEQATAAQVRFRDFARASSDWFWECDRDGQIQMLSDRLTALLGVPAAKHVGRRFDEIGVMLPLEDGTVLMRTAQYHNRPFRDQLFGMHDRAGALLVFHLSGVPVFDVASGEFLGYRGAGMDITSRMRSEQQSEEIKRSLENMLEELTNKNVQLDMASAKAEEALKVKNEFLAAMSHELRTPLNAIIGFAEAMKLEIFGDISDQYKSYSNDILSAGRHLLGLINDVLDVAVLESDRIQLEIEPVSLKAVIEKAFNLVTMRAHKKQLNIRSVLIQGDWTLHVDMRRATQVFVNLFSNAVKFTPDRGSVGIEVELLADHMLAITVWDNGIGIPRDKHHLVFEKFQQCVDNIYSRREEGTGLGLHISKHLAQLMGGDIFLDSEEGAGSRFTVVLPLYSEGREDGTVSQPAGI
ncbi:sensor histidine kinase [Govanella unica]|uniref:histidine kinase n=1 Tax=Govanella unica TaxID=2975056 RepID=A0A9X3TWA7_9PROT|nr:PAS domain-containing hybrid sensor histidine kinase/response regulator [Govania unica]MDA5193131.1 ATP-binding protein [Govania unica]